LGSIKNKKHSKCQPTKFLKHSPGNIPGGMNERKE
jgi:hypothetical protein